MKKYLLILFFIFILKITCFAQGQFPQVYDIDLGTGSTDIYIHQSASISSANLTLLSATSKIGAVSLASNSSDPYFYNWGQVCLPSTTGSVSYGYMACNEFYARIDPSNNYATVTATTLNIRPSAGNTTQWVTINGQNSYFGQNSVVSLTGNMSNIGGTIWHEVYLTMNCSQATGWLSGAYLSIPSPQSYEIVGGRVCTDANACIYSGTVNGALISLFSEALVYSSSGSYEYKVSPGWSGTITCTDASYNTSTPSSYQYTANSNDYSLNFILSSSAPCSSPVITTNPSSETVNPGGSTSFTVAASQGNIPYTYLWQVSPDGINWTNIVTSGSNPTYGTWASATMTLSGISSSDNGLHYQCLVSSASPCGNYSRYSGVAILTVQNETPPNISLIILGTNHINAGSSVQFDESSDQLLTSVQWSFPGGSPSVSNSLLPVITYSIPGTYRVTLTGCNSSGLCSTVTQIGYVNVSSTSTVPAATAPSQAIAINGNQCSTSEPIQLGTGSYVYIHKDFAIPVIKDTLSFTRFYNSLNNTINGPVGYGWSHSYNYYINIQKDPSTQQDTLWNVYFPDGHSEAFVPIYAGSGVSFPLSMSTTDSLQKNSGGDFTMFTTDNHQYHFTSAGTLNQITDLNGNTTTLNYTNNNLTSVVGPGGRTLNFSYNSSNNIAIVTDPLNRSVNLTYDGNGNLQSVIDANGGTTSFSYDANHNMLTAINPLNNIIVSNTYDSMNRVITQQDAYSQTTSVAYNTPSTGDATVTNPDNSQFTAHHDTAYRKTSIKDELGYTKYYAYDTYSNENSFTDENGENETRQFDQFGNLLVRNQPGSVSTQITYNSFNSPLQLTDPNGNVTGFTYDGNDNLISIQLPDQSSQSFTYFSNGLKNTFKDGNGNQTMYTYSVYGDLLSVTAPNGTRSYTYDAAGRKISATDENNNTIQYTYDNSDNIKSIIDPLYNTITFNYDANNKLLSVTDKNGNTTNYTYDNKSRMLSRTDANGGISKYGYDVRDNLISVTDPDNHVISYAYDFKNRKTAATNALGTAQSQFDGVGNVTVVTDGTNISTQYTYTPTYKIQTMMDGLSNTYTYAYDKNNNLLTTTNPLNKNTAYTYDQLNRLSSITDAASNTTKVTYDANGNKKTVSDPNGHTQTYTYDAANRLVSYLDAEGNMESYTIDPVGNVTMITKPTGTITKTYDVINRLVSVANSGGNNYGYTYDKNNNVLSSSSGSGTSNFTYDKLNHLTQYTDPYNNKVIYSYDAAGNEQYITYPGNKMISYTYDKANNLKTVSDWLSHTFTYTYDASGRITQLLYPNAVQCNYSFDKAGRLASINNVSAGSTLLAGSTYTLDAVGNRIGEQKTGAIPSKLLGSSKSYTYGSDDRLLKDPVWTYVNDNAGNRTSQSTGKVSETYSVTVDNLLNSVLDTSNVLTVYYYDANGHRLAKNAANTINRYVLDLNSSISKVLQITDASGVVRSQYVYGSNLLERIDSTGNLSCYHYDGQHNSVALSDVKGNITDTYSYSPFGTVVQHTGNINQPFTFLGEFGVEQETPSLYYDRARYYDACTSRFLSKDSYAYSLLNPQTINRYVYATNNPLTRFDNNGLYQDEDNDSKNESLLTQLYNFSNDLTDNPVYPFVSAALKLDKFDVVQGAVNIAVSTGQFAYDALNNRATGSEWAHTLTTIAITGGGIIGGTAVGVPVAGGIAIGLAGYGIERVVDYEWQKHNWDQVLNKLW